MADQVDTRAKRRRSQEDRSAETKAKLLKATLELLIEGGYARLSTTDVATRAGLSRGAQVHHFPLKADLVAAAIEDLARQYSQYLERTMEKLPRGKAGAKIALEALWEVFASPLHEAYMELRVAARTDPDVRRVERAILAAVVWPTLDKFAEALAGPAIHEDRVLREQLQAVTVMVRGVAESRVDYGEAWSKRQLAGLVNWLTPIVLEAQSRPRSTSGSTTTKRRSGG